MDAAGLVADRALIGQASRAEQVAAVLRTRISTGWFRPGQRLAEDEITAALQVSRNTLREAFRLLTHERLLVQELNRGTFVRVLDVDDVVDLYRVRTHVECSVVRTVSVPPPGLPRIAAAVDVGRAALGEQDWRALGTANIGFHQELVAVAGSPRLDELMRGVLAELRLVFHVMDDPRWFHEPYLARNQEILDVLTRGDGPAAAELLRAYLADAEHQLVTAYAELRG
jgi:DNA-binding GntR family transcriptional regulator